ncbi:MAG TPA: hypothetical protein VFV31_07815 [Chitinophagaceae bacterium]|nr:hypothetical protein [Chitinophagaceae bacterium]
MKKIFFILFSATFLLTGCLETTQEITINDDGSGTIVSTSDFSALLGLAKQMGGAGELEKAGDMVKDTVISMQQGADSIPNLTAEEKEMLRKGSLRVNMNMKEEKFLTSLTIPFSNAADIAKVNKLANKALGETMKEQMSGGSPLGGDQQMPEASSFDDYYKFEFSNGELTKKLDKDKYAGAESDEYLKGMKEATSMGLSMKATYIINLPRPAEKAEGKGVKLSEDKKKVTITADLDDFFSNPEKLEYKIKY